MQRPCSGSKPCPWSRKEASASGVEAGGAARGMSGARLAGQAGWEHVGLVVQGRPFRFCFKSLWGTSGDSQALSYGCCVETGLGEGKGQGKASLQPRG